MKFLEVEKLLERQTNRKLKHIHFDSGGEFLDGNFIEYLKTKGIKYTHSCAREPNQNAIAERKNRTHMDKALAMLHGAKMTNSYWGDFFPVQIFS